MVSTAAGSLTDWLPPTKPVQWRKGTPTGGAPGWGEHELRASTVPTGADWKPQSVALKPPVVCQVTGFEGGEAVCTVYLAGFELRRVGFPAELIRRLSLDVDQWFGWIMRDPGSVQVHDIRPMAAPTADLPPDEVAKLVAQSEAFQRRVVEQGPWPEYTGDGM